jgi:hypothetical protein
MRRTIAALAVALIALLTAAPADAAPPVAPDDGSRVWAVRPAGADGKPDARTHFVLQGAPGAQVRDKVLILNSSHVPVAFSVYGTDAFNTPQGAFDLLNAATKPVDVGSWIIVGSSTVVIPAGKAVAVPFTVTIPATATPGDHAGGVVVSLAGVSPADGVKLDSRVAVRVYLRIPGNLRPSLAVGPVTVKFRGGGNPFAHGTATVTYTVTNPGNIRLRAGQKIKITGPFGGTLATLSPPDLTELLPSQAATFTVKLPHVFPYGPITAHVELAPYPDPEQPIGQSVPAASGEGYTWAISWLLLLIVLLVLAGIGWFWWVRRRATLRRLDEAMRLAREEAIKQARRDRKAAKAGATP